MKWKADKPTGEHHHSRGRGLPCKLDHGAHPIRIIGKAQDDDYQTARHEADYLGAVGVVDQGERCRR